jgi:DNA-binding MarR family transcriptional regulator
LTTNPVTDHDLEVAQALRPAVLRLARELRRETEQFGVTSRQATLLAIVKDMPESSLSDLAAEEGISTAALSGHVDRLVAHGLVERHRSETDRRRVGLRLTEEGGRVLRSVRERRTAWLARRLADLSQDEARRVERALPALAKLVGARPA